MTALRSFLRKIGKKFVIVTLIGVLWASVAFFTAAVLNTTAVEPLDAEGIVLEVETAGLEHAQALWVLIIPLSFLAVILTRPGKGR